jgi:hypothetical protein
MADDAVTHTGDGSSSTRQYLCDVIAPMMHRFSPSWLAINSYSKDGIVYGMRVARQDVAVFHLFYLFVYLFTTFDLAGGKIHSVAIQIVPSSRSLGEA